MTRAQVALPIEDMFSQCQRWHCRQPSYRPAGEPFDRSRYHVDIAEYAEAKRFIETHHYAASYVASRLQVGLWVKPTAFQRERLVGVVAFSVPIQERAIPAWFGGLPPREGVEIGRIALSPEVPGNGETFTLARAFRLLRRELPEVQAVLSYADPLERRDAAGNVVKRGHTGVIYAAFSSVFLGRSSPRTLTLARDGRCINDRTLSKLRRGERGAAYAERQLVAMGAPPRTPFEDGTTYLARALRSGAFYSVRHPGNYAFGWWLGNPRKTPLPPRGAMRYPTETVAARSQPILAQSSALEAAATGNSLLA